jgi:predicted Zn-dependent protease
MSEAPLSSAEALARIDVLLERRRLAQARQLLEQALRQAPDDVELLLRGAWIDHLDDDEESAHRTLRAALAHDPDHAGLRRLLFSVLEELERFEEAEQVVIGLLRDFPEEASFYAAYAQLMLRTLHLDKARELASEGLRRDPDDEDCLFAHALAELIHSPAAAAEGALPELVRHSPDHARTMWLLVVALQQRGQPRAALRVAQALLRSQPTSPQVLQLVRELRIATHWSLVPLWPMTRFGWAGSALLWGGAVLALTLGRRLPAPLGGGIAVLWLTYVVYSWIWPPLLRRWMLRD